MTDLSQLVSPAAAVLEACRVRGLTIAAAAFFVFWLALLMRHTGPRQAAEALLAVSLAVFVLFASSAATTLQQEQRDALFTRAGEFEEQATAVPEGVDTL